MRTTISVDDILLQRAKAAAAATGRSLNDFVGDAIRAALAPRQAGVRRQPPKLPTFKGNGTQPGVDLDDSAALLDLMYEMPTPRVARVAEPAPPATPRKR